MTKLSPSPLPPIKVTGGAGHPMRTALNTLLTGSTEQNHLNNQMGGGFHQPHSPDVIVPTWGNPNPTHTALAETLVLQRANAQYDEQHGGRMSIMKRLELLRKNKTQKRNKRSKRKKTQKRSKRKKTQKRNKRSKRKKNKK